MRSTVPMHIAKCGYLGISVLLITLGALFIVQPEISSKIIGILCGSCMIAFGIIKLVGFFSGDLFRLAFQYDLACGILIVLVGVVLLLHPAAFLNGLCMLLGLMVLADGLFKIQMTIEAKRFGISQWWLILLTAILAGIFGLGLLFFLHAGVRVMTVLLGLTLLADGILNVCTMLTAVRIIRHQLPDNPEPLCEIRKG